MSCASVKARFCAFTHLNDNSARICLNMSSIPEKSESSPEVLSSLRHAESVPTDLFDMFGRIDSSGTVKELSGRIFDLTNVRPELLLGQSFTETVFWQSSVNTARILAQAIREASETGSSHVLLDFRVSADEKLPIAITLRRLDGDSNSIIVIGQLIAPFFVGGEVIPPDNDYLLQAADLAEIGLWHWDLTEERVYSTARCNDIFELSAYERLSPRAFLDIVHPDDRADLDEVLRDSRQNGARFETEFRVVYSDGAVEWVAAAGKTFMGKDERPLRMLGVVRKITEQKLAAADLAAVYIREKKARDEAVEANRAKDLFLAFVSHELRAPLNAILGWSRILLTKDVDADTRRNALETIERSARAQTKLIDDLVDSARVASGRLRLEYRPINLYEVVRGSFEAQKPSADARRISFDLASESEEINVFGDSERLQQVFGNLISNAIKFTPEGGRVEIRIEARENAAVISVKDTGRGISAEALPNVFRQFSQGDVDMEKSHAGLGLGLSIAKILAERHGGSIRAESGGIGSGSKFTVEIPLTNTLSDSGSRPNVSEFVESQQPLSGTRILIVDDDPDSLEVLRMFLEEQGAVVLAAPGAQAAKSVFTDSDTGVPDLLISDLAMPEEDGYELIASIRKLETRSSGAIPAIALSAFVTPESRKRAIESGFQSYFTKPFQAESLLCGIIELLIRK